ncbi:hypothetical protein [Schleiferilactobacillus shenzhenensis]|uniref:Uncharacterized protein n=1 Tax=Schleiferilactobacillus shenzhenensis LY-73 TaxID=1231336 RepID=U4TJE5_9LACO|nr:hypothetical protein [Schleiferilactobacillus shenzhenensis]ERL64941.1 hypothetical protein L248_3103 [Schleiferilactobacillus shenzhenensis LY-73]
MQVGYDPRGCKAFFKKHRPAAPVIRQHIAATLARQLTHGLARVKRASRLPYAGQTVYECRVNPPTGPLRCAFVYSDTTVTVVWLSMTIQKDVFTADLERFLKPGGG